MHLSLPKQFPLFILASSVCWSLQCLISTLTQGGSGGHFFRLTCSVVLWGGRNTANKYHWCVWGALTVYGPHWVCPSYSVSRVYTAKAPGCSAGALSKAGPAFCALPRSKLLRFRFSGLGWACVLCPSQVQAAQVTRCLASIVTSSWGVCLIASPVPATWFSGCTMGTARVQPWWIREIRIGDGVGEEKTYLFINIRLD